MFSKSCEYAMRAVIYICSKRKTGEILKVQEISHAIDAPSSYTSKILQQLSKAGIIHSMKGPNGGFYVDEKGKTMKLIDIVKAIDGEELFNNCCLGLKRCSGKKPCLVHFQYKSIKLQLKRMLEDTVVEQLDTTFYRNSNKGNKNSSISAEKSQHQT